MRQGGLCRLETSGAGLSSQPFRSGSFVSGGAAGLLKFLKFLRGQKPAEIEFVDSTNESIAIVTSSSGDTLHISKDVFRLYEVSRIRKAVAQITEPLLTESIESMTVTSQ